LRNPYSFSDGVLWRPEGEQDPACSEMPTFAKRRRPPTPTRRVAAPSSLELLRDRLLMRVQDEQRRTGLERPHDMAVLELERVREQLALAQL
jgi:precorrin-6B methylase 1